MLVDARTMAVDALLALLLAGGALEAVGAEPLNQLLADYRAYELPLPPAEARLVIRKIGGAVVNGVQQYRYELAFLIESMEGHKLYWIGCKAATATKHSTDEAAPLTRLAVDRTRPADLQRWPDFPTYPDLALAVQCQARGRHELALALLQRSRKPWLRSPFNRSKPRPRDDRAALAELAWYYWCTQFARAKGDRQPIVNRLRRILEGPHGIDSPARRNVLTDMEQTLALRIVPADRLEAAVESLLELDAAGNCVDRNPAYQRLRDAGFDAVPVLIRHLHDYRLTRDIAATVGNRYTWHYRVADVVARLLNGLASEELSYDFLERQGRGTSLDKGHVLHWWGQVQGQGENK